MEQFQYLLPTKLNLDDTPLNLKSDQAFFLRGINIETSIDAGNKGGNRFQLKPEPGNYLYTNVALPEGINKVVGSYVFVETTQVYVWVENSNGNHLIYRINGKTRTYDIVYRFCPGYVLGGSPEYFVAKGRATIKSLCRYKADGSTELYQELLWVDNRNENCRGNK